MPLIPAQSLPTVTPDGASGAFQRVNADPNAFGAGVAKATGELGRAVGTAGDELDIKGVFLLFGRRCRSCRR